MTFDFGIACMSDDEIDAVVGGATSTTTSTKPPPPPPPPQPSVNPGTPNTGTISCPPGTYVHYLYNGDGSITVTCRPLGT